MQCDPRGTSGRRAPAAGPSSRNSQRRLAVCVHTLFFFALFGFDWIVLDWSQHFVCWFFAHSSSPTAQHSFVPSGGAHSRRGRACADLRRGGPRGLRRAARAGRRIGGDSAPGARVGRPRRSAGAARTAAGAGAAAADAAAEGRCRARHDGRADQRACGKPRAPGIDVSLLEKKKKKKKKRQFKCVGASN
jgi:hypothetical protein